MSRPHPALFALRTTLDQLGVPYPPVQSEYALGRLCGLELAESLGIDDARAALADEGVSLRSRCFPSLEPGEDAA